MPPRSVPHLSFLPAGAGVLDMHLGLSCHWHHNLRERETLLRDNVVDSFFRRQCPALFGGPGRGPVTGGASPFDDIYVTLLVK